MEQADVDEIIEDVVKEMEEEEARAKAEKLQQDQVTLCRPHVSRTTLRTDGPCPWQG